MQTYLLRYAEPGPLLSDAADSNIELVVVLPAYAEPDLGLSVQSILNCTPPPNAMVELIVVLNRPDNDAQAIAINKKNSALLNQIDKPHWLEIHTISVVLPEKHAGVGLARKIGMDEAVRRFESLNKDGIISCFDADSSCEPNYLVELIRFFSMHPKMPACAIKYAHPLQQAPEALREAIIQYELHLRYLVQAQRFAGYPLAFHTVGSAMAVRSRVYQKQGGMNKRKAGEDFHFLHRHIPSGHFGELNTTCIYPGIRTSERVPFGTGRALNQWMTSHKNELETYDFYIFKALQVFISYTSAFAKTDFQNIITNLDPTIIQWLASQKFDQVIARIQKDSSSESFVQKYYEWLSGLRFLKLIHHMRDQGFSNKPVLDEARLLANELDWPETISSEALLNLYRQKQGS